MDDYRSKPIAPRLLLTIVEEPAEPRAEPLAMRPPVTFDEPGLRGRVLCDEELMHEMIELFLADCPPRIAAIREAARRGDGATLRLEAHAVSGAAGNIGGVGLAEAARIAEQVGAESRMDAALAACHQVEVEAAALMVALMSFAARAADAQVVRARLPTPRTPLAHAAG